MSAQPSASAKIRFARHLVQCHPDFESVRRQHSYDALGRVLETTLSIDAEVAGLTPVVLTARQRFDRRYGRVTQTDHPALSGAVSTYSRYAATGQLVREGFAEDYNAATPDSSSAYRVLLSTDARGQALTLRYGERAGLVDAHARNVYDEASGWMLAQCVSFAGDPACPAASWPASGSAVPLDLRYRYDGYGNLLRLGHFGLWPNSGTGPVSESFSYDRLHRLTQTNRTSAGIPGSETVQYRYDVIGHLLAKSDWSSAAPGGCTATVTSTCPYQYQTGSHRIASVAQAGGSISYTHDGNGNVIQKSGGGITHSLLYDADNLPQRLSSSDRISDFYTLAGARYRHLARSGSGTVLRETVHLDKSYERETANGQTLERYYLSSDVLLTVQNGSRSLNYLHSDRLGSPVSITGKNASGPMEMKEHRGFDAFGKARDGQWGNSTQGKLYPSTTPYHLAKPNLRGFTQHEHLDEFALIHMNGRLYDPNLGRFYGVDPIIQFPSNSQSLNPYSYLMNNPLSGMDPTGYSCSLSGDDKSCNEDDRLNPLRIDVARQIPLPGSRLSRTETVSYTITSKDPGYSRISTLIEQSTQNGVATFRQIGASVGSGARTKQTADGEGSASDGDISDIQAGHQRVANAAAAVGQGASAAGELIAPCASNQSAGGCAGEVAVNAAVTYAGVKVVGSIAGTYRWLADAYRRSGNNAKAVEVEADLAKWLAGGNTSSGHGLGVSDAPSRYQGPWTQRDLARAQAGQGPLDMVQLRNRNGVEMPLELHHADQMPGSAIHEIDSKLHRQPGVHGQPTQGVTPEMRKRDAQLHWQLRGQEMGNKGPGGN